MPYIIDGHNLIPKAGLRLASVDDEHELIAILQEYGRRSRKAIEVYFDGAPAGRAATRNFGQVTAHFVSHRSSADAAIKLRLQNLGRAARNWTVVTSDRAIRAAAAAAHASTETSEQFAARVKGSLATASSRPDGSTSGRDGGLSDDDLRDWLELFGTK